MKLGFCTWDLAAALLLVVAIAVLIVLESKHKKKMKLYKLQADMDTQTIESVPSADETQFIQNVSTAVETQELEVVAYDEEPQDAPKMETTELNTEAEAETVLNQDNVPLKAGSAYGSIKLRCL